jgi:hypothetical protein
MTDGLTHIQCHLLSLVVQRCVSYNETTEEKDEEENHDEEGEKKVKESDDESVVEEAMEEEEEDEEKSRNCNGAQNVPAISNLSTS